MLRVCVCVLCVRVCVCVCKCMCMCVCVHVSVPEAIQKLDSLKLLVVQRAKASRGTVPRPLASDIHC